MSESTLVKLRRHYKTLIDDSRTFEPYWNDVRKYILPERGRNLQDNTSEANDGTLRDANRLNGVASRSVGILASGMQSGLTSKARPWFVLNHPDPAVNRVQSVREWYDIVQEILTGIFRRSNIYASLLHTYTEMAAFGQGALLVLEHPERILYSKPFTTGSYVMSLDEWGEVDVFIHREHLTVHQIERAYGRNVLPQCIKSDLSSGRFNNRYTVLNAILKHPQEFGITLPEGREAASVHFLEKAQDTDGLLRTAYYDSFPVMTPRWDAIADDVYGRAPVRSVIGDVKMLQKLEEDGLKGLAKLVNPPLRIPPELERRGVDTRPGALNPVTSMNEHALAPLFVPQVNIQQVEYKIAAVSERIKEGLYTNLFLALLQSDNPQMTAREVVERHEEKLLMLGPVLERIHTELLDPLISRTFDLAVSAGLIPPPPAELRDGEVQIEYVSILSQAQKAVGVNRIEQSMTFLGNIVAVFPELRNAIDPYELYQEYNYLIGVQGRCLRDRDEYDKINAEQAKQQQMMQQAEVGNSLASSAKLLSDTDVTNVREVLGAAQGAVF